jgi:hypothetical protein
MNERYYILDGHKVVAVGLLEWGTWLETHRKERIVAKTMIGDAEVSTVFLGLDHRFGEGPPLIFESLIFGGVHDGEMEHYSTWEEAEAGHAKLVAMLSDKGVKE